MEWLTWRTRKGGLVLFEGFGVELANRPGEDIPSRSMNWLGM